MTHRLFFPWFYKGEDFFTDIINCSDPDYNHTKYENSRLELIRLYEDFHTNFSSLYENLHNTIVYINIGGCCLSSDNNELLKQKCYDRNNPEFIDKIDEKYNVLYIYIDGFPDPDSDSTIIKMTTEKGFRKINNNTWQTEDTKKTICLYNTHMPTFIDINFLTTENARNIVPIPQIRIIKDRILLKQTESNDREFVEDFYEKLTSFIRITKYTTIVSTASFQETDNKISGTNNLNFELFPTITELLYKEPRINNILLLIWTFNTNYFFIYRKLEKINYNSNKINFTEKEDKLILTHSIQETELTNYYKEGDKLKVFYTGKKDMSTFYNTRNVNFRIGIYE